jgi:hypothetical protein
VLALLLGLALLLLFALMPLLPFVLVLLLLMLLFFYQPCIVPFRVLQLLLYRLELLLQLFALFHCSGQLVVRVYTLRQRGVDAHGVFLAFR